MMPLSYELPFIVYPFRVIVHTFPPLTRMRRLSPRFQQVIRYFFTGGTVTLIDIGLYLLLIHIGVYYLVASVISGTIGFFSAFLFQKHFVFKKHDRTASHFLRFCVLGAWNLFATNFVLFACVHWLKVPEDIAKVLSNASVVLWNYFLYKFLVYV
jgi:putative flippase GtrA